MSRARGTLLGPGQWKGEKEGISFGGARQMNSAAQTAGQLADDRRTSTAPDGFRCRPIVRDPALYDVACKRQLHSQFWISSVELCMSCHIGQQLEDNQPKLPAAFSFNRRSSAENKTRIARRSSRYFVMEKQKLLEGPRGIGEEPLIPHMQRPMNNGALMQEVYDVEQRGLDRHAIRLHRSG
jgi:hypothetical protein